MLCNKLMEDIQEAIVIPDSEESNMDPQVRQHLFNYPIEFMDSMVEISKNLTTVTPDQYSIFNFFFFFKLTQLNFLSQKVNY
jgi:hypothetical protein